MIGKRLRELRKERGIKQVQLSELVGISNAVICRYETDKRLPKVENVLKLARFFDVSVDYLLGYVECRKHIH